MILSSFSFKSVKRMIDHNLANPRHTWKLWCIVLLFVFLYLIKLQLLSCDAAQCGINDRWTITANHTTWIYKVSSNLKNSCWQVTINYTSTHLFPQYICTNRKNWHNPLFSFVLATFILQFRIWKLLIYVFHAVKFNCNYSSILLSPLRGTDSIVEFIKYLCTLVIK